MPRRRTATLLAALMLVAGCGGDGGTASPEAPDPLREGRTIYGDTCSVCHGSRGQGGVGPALADVAEVWPDCNDQVEWITGGSDGWRAAHGDTYGATGRPVEGGMPAQGENLTEAEIRLVAAFQRAEYGGEEPQAALSGCGVEAG
jgi:mono/diheme cytochrome c family protein